jgi:hypothetical protein
LKPILESVGNYVEKHILRDVKKYVKKDVVPILTVFATMAEDIVFNTFFNSKVSKKEIFNEFLPTLYCQKLVEKSVKINSDLVLNTGFAKSGRAMSTLHMIN